MRTINEYLISKTHKSKTCSNEFPDGFCLVISFGTTYDVLYDAYYDVMFEDMYGEEPNAFLLEREDIVDYFNDEGVTVYKIPKQFKTIEALENAYRHGEIKEKELEEIKTVNELF